MNKNVIISLLNGIHRHRKTSLMRIQEKAYVTLNPSSRMMLAHLYLLLDIDGLEFEEGEDGDMMDVTSVLAAVPFEYHWDPEIGFALI